MPQSNIFRRGDVFVLLGELFGCGYANGLVNEARAAGMDIIGITVGGRDEDNTLRPLNAKELAAAEANAKRPSRLMVFSRPCHARFPFRGSPVISCIRDIQTIRLKESNHDDD